MKVTPITKENLKFYKNFITAEDARFISDDLRILPLGLVADDIKGKGNQAAGALCIRPDDFMLNITSFYVAPDYRGKGAGKFLLDEAKRLFGEENMEFNVEFLVHGKEEEGLSDFLESYGFEGADPEYEIYSTTVGALKDTKLYGKSGMGEPFSAIPEKYINGIQSIAEKKGEILPLNGMRSDAIDRDVSVGIIKDGKIDYFATVERLTENALLLSTVYVIGSAPAALLHLLEKVIALVSEKYSDDTKILIQPIDEASEGIIEGIFGDPRNISCRYRYVIET